MRSSPAWHRFRVATGVLLTLLAGGVAAPSLRASCGDYVVLGPASARTSPGHPAQAGPAGMSREASHPPAQPHKPCTGPLCSGRPVPPPVAPPTVPTHDWPCVVSAPTFTSAHDFAYLLEEPVRAPAFHGDSVFHPPR